MESHDSYESHAPVPVTGTQPVNTLDIYEEDELPPPLEEHSKEQNLVTHAHGTSTVIKTSAEVGVAGDSDDVLVVLDMPENSIIGYDAVSLTAKSFKGVSNIAPGAHFFWWTSPNGMGSRSGLWIVSSPDVQRVHVMQWSRYNPIALPIV